MFLVSSSSLAQFGSRDEAALRRTFSLDFLLDGSVQRVARRLRVTMRLLDLRDGNRIVWARRFDRQMNDLLSLQDEIAAEVVAQIDPEILLIEGRRAAHRPPTDSTAYDLVLRALPLIVRLRRDEFREAGALLERALELEPEYAAAHAWRAYWAMFCLGQGWAERDDEVLAEAGRHAERAITLDPQDARGLTIAGHVRAFLNSKPREALELHGRALSLNPNLAMAWGFSAITYTYLGDLDEATRRFARYKRLSPMDPNAFFFDAGMVILELCKRDYGAAVMIGRRASELNPMFTAGLKHYLAALGHAGLADEAVAVRAKLFAIEPGFTLAEAIRRSRYEQPTEIDHYVAGLRLAGIPES
jgi:tetratricopeptide (TPR) repeat protein